MAELGALLQSLRNGEMPALDVAEVEVLVGWLLGKGDESANLPKPEHDPVLQQMVFYRLDATLFSAGELRLVPAGLGPEQPSDLRKTRFRRLAGAFHPDRHPELADWLTERSQAVLRAYGRFKHGDEAPPRALTPAPPYPGYPPPRPPQRGPFRNSRIRMRAAAESLRRRFGNDRFLAHKLIGGLALIAMLPVLNLLLVPEPGGQHRFESAGGAASYSSLGSGRIESAGGAEAPSDNNRDPIGSFGEAVTSGGDFESAGGATSYSGVAQESSEDSALLAAAREAIRLGDSEYAHLPSVDEQLAAMGLDTDTERLYQRIRGESRQRSRAAAAKASTANSRIESAPTTAAPADSGIEAPASVGVDSIRDIGRTSNPPVESHSPMQSTPTTAAAAIAVRSAPELAASELTLGLLGSHPAGAVLRGFAADIEAGNLIALLARFDRQARHGTLRGSDAIARHYRSLFEQNSPRRTVLKIVRVERNGGGWRVETELLIEGVQEQRVVSAQDGRAAFTLAGEPLRIQRLEF